LTDEEWQETLAYQTFDFEREQMDTSEVTISDMEKALGLKREAVYGLFQFWEAAGIVTRAEHTRKHPSGKGRGETIYNVPGDIAERTRAFLDGGK
jgi:predicted ArsR family transcriptional regulator